jgi:hypothetical protein
VLARWQPGFKFSAGMTSIHLDIKLQCLEHSWDGYERYIKVLISFYFIPIAAHTLPSLAVNSKPEQTVDSLPLLGFNPLTFGTPMHRSDHTAKPHLHAFMLMPCLLVKPHVWQTKKKHP